MNDLLRNVLDAHGGLSRWNEITTVSATVVTGGGLFPLKGLVQDSNPRRLVVSAHEEFASLSPFGQPDWRTSFRPGRVAIEASDGTVIREQDAPRTMFAGHGLQTPWNPLQRAYFSGYALWTYLTTPFFMAMPGFEVHEIEPLDEGAEQWRGLKVRFPDGIVSHCNEQEIYFGDDFLLRRHDYRVDVAGSFPAAQLVDRYADVQGFKVPTRRRAYVRGPDGKPVRDLLMVAIDLDEFSFA